MFLSRTTHARQNRATVCRNNKEEDEIDDHFGGVGPLPFIAVPFPHF